MKKIGIKGRYILTDAEMKREKGPRRAKRGLLGCRESSGINPKLEKRTRKLPKAEEET